MLNNSTVITSTTQFSELLFNCNFDASTLLTGQCGGIATNSVPVLALASIVTTFSETVSGSAPAILLTDVKSISKFFFQIVNFKFYFAY